MAWQWHTTILSVVLVVVVMLMSPWAPLLAEAVVKPEEALGMPGCDVSCGDMKVPYPFGMGPLGCYYSPAFKLTCDRTAGKNPRLLLGDGDGTLQVQDIDMENNLLSATRTGGEIAIDGNGDGAFDGGIRDDGPYTLGHTNEIVLTGCNVRATLKNSEGATMSSCSSVCEDGDGPIFVPSRLVDAMMCSGIGCCQADIANNNQVEASPKLSYSVHLDYFGGNRSADGMRLPVRVFVAEKGWFENRSVANQLLDSQPHSMAIPVLLNWEAIAVGPGAESDSNLKSEVCINNSTVSRSVCKSKESMCNMGIRGYKCLCKDGYTGNPYLADGCTDVDECNDKEDNGCYGVCTNTKGWFNCSCPPGTQGDESMPGGCVAPATAHTCNTSCGSVDAPYPFGIGPVGCYWPGFKLTCDHASNPPKLFLSSTQTLFHVKEISIRNNTVRVHGNSATRPLDRFITLGYSGGLDSGLTGRGDAPYSLSTSNELILVGCNVQATLYGYRDGAFGEAAIITGCTSFCPSNRNGSGNVLRQVPSGSSDRYCYGIGCCQARIPRSTNNSMPTNWLIRPIDEKYYVEAKNSAPASMLLAEEGWFDQRQVSDALARDFEHHRTRLRSELQVPLLLDWEVVQGWPRQSAGGKTCPKKVADGLCISKHSYCKQGSRGYSCHCSNSNDDGNPYVQGRGGCAAPPGSHKSLNTSLYIVIGVAIGAAVILLFFTALSVSKKIKHRRAQMLRRQFFEKNRGQLLEQLVSHRADIAERMIITLEEIEKATNNFDEARVLGGGGHGTVYKGILSDQHVVAIKKPKMVVQKEIDEFINEVAILSQINHRNVVKLYGCCLETEVPLLVYEFISNGTLCEHLHVEGPKSLSLADRLRIAIETAKSLAYLHSTASIPIIHRDVKSVNILLDDTLTAKVADFGASRYIPVDRSGVTTKVQGTIGYLDPMYFYTQRLTEKSDVYSFGVTLIELLTRKKPYAYISSEGDGLVAHFSNLFTEGNYAQLLDQQVIDEGGKKVEEVAALAVSCVKMRGEDRPTMRQVELTLEGLQLSRRNIVGNVLIEEIGNNRIEENCSRIGDERNNKESTRSYSMEEEFMLSSRYPR